MKTVFNTEAFIRNVSASFGWCLFREQFEYIVRMKRKSNWGGNKNSENEDLIVLRCLEDPELSRKEKHCSKGTGTYQILSGLSSQVTSQHVNWNLLWFTLLLCEDIWAMVFLAIQPNLANPDLLTLCSLVSLLVCHFCTFLNVSCHVQVSELNRRIAASNPRQAVWNVSSQQIDVKAEHFYQALLSYTSNDPRWDVSLCGDVRNKQSLDLWVCSSSLWTKPTVHWETFRGLEHSLC